MRYLLVALLGGCSFQHGISSEGPIDAALGLDADGAIAIDARPPDAAPDATTAFDPANCPVEYTNNTISSSPNTRYRVIAGGATISMHNGDCNDDHAGWTHLVVIDSATEGQQLRDAIGSSTFYVGAVQQRSQAAPVTNWYSFTGAAQSATTWQLGQPNDNGGGEDDEQNFAAADSSSTGQLNDVSGTFSYGAVCECDGAGIPANIAQMILDSAP